MVRRSSRISHKHPAPRSPHLERTPRRPTVFVVGLGRLGSAFARGLAAHGWQVEAWSRTPRRRRLPGVTVRTGGAPTGVADARLVLLTVPDRAIEMVATDLAARGLLGEGQVVAHCAGSLGLAPLRAAAEAGAAIGSLHPLVAASPGQVQLAGKAAAIDGTAAATRVLRRVARTVGLKPIAIPAEARVRYHAAASLAANGLVALADLAAELLATAGMSRDQALSALLPLLASSLENVERVGLPAALTGPVARGDAAVVDAHLAALRDLPQNAAYRALSLRMVEIAKAQGAADPEGLARIERLLRRQVRRR